MKSVLLALKFVYENLPLLMASGAVCFGIVLKVRKFLRMSKEQKVEQLKAQAEKIVELVKKQLLSIVSKAEKEWGGGTGSIKKSWVWEQLIAQYGKLMEFIETGFIDKQLIDDLIEAAVDELNAQKEKNGKIAAAVEKAS